MSDDNELEWAQALKQDLLRIELVEDNHFLDQYIDLLQTNKDTKPQKGNTQKHHIIPKYYYKHNNLPINNNKDNLIYLMYKDHCLAHYYLALCSKTSLYAWKNYISLQHICHNQNFPVIEEDFLQQLPLLQELYELSRVETSKRHKGKTISPETREKERQSHLGKKYAPMSDQGRQNISQSHKGLIPPVANNSQIAQKISHTRIQKRLTSIYLGDQQKWVPQEELSKWLDQGWSQGVPQKQIDSKRQRNLGKKYVFKDGVIKEVNDNNINEYLSQGWVRGRGGKNAN